ncbi:outer membrane protein assembly factor BamE domain-containing protein, partial [Salmonella enterica subsp. enterica serovar Infantis]
GTPMMTYPIATNTWFYVFIQQTGKKNVTQHTQTITINTSGFLTNNYKKPKKPKKKTAPGGDEPTHPQPTPARVYWGDHHPGRGKKPQKT